MFDSKSRYSQTETAQYRMPTGRLVEYKRRRMRPPSELLPATREVTVVQGERLDLLAARVLGDPELFWRIADVNLEFDPFELTRHPGRVIRIPQA